MPLDPLVKAFLDQASATPRPKPWDVPIAVLRKNFAGMSRQRHFIHGANLGGPHGVVPRHLVGLNCDFFPRCHDYSAP